MSKALLREVPASFDRALVSEHGRRPRISLAREQHLRYAQALDEAGYDVEMIPADDSYPDCVFIEDTAVIIGSTAVVTRPGAVERRGEVDATMEHLQTMFPLARIEEPGTLDGGDVMFIGATVFVGRSQRTNEAGIAQLRDIASSFDIPVKTVPVQEVLHLKSAVLPVGDSTVVVTPGAVDESLLSGLQILHEAQHERHMFSALRLSNGHVLVTSTAADTASAVARLGVNVVPIDVSEFQVADGGLTCMSILIED